MWISIAKNFFLSCKKKQRGQKLGRLQPFQPSLTLRAAPNAIYFLNFLTTFCTEMELMGFATIDNSKSFKSTNSKFALKKNIGVTIEKMQKKNEISKFWSLWVLPNDGRIAVELEDKNEETINQLYQYFDCLQK